MPPYIGEIRMFAGNFPPNGWRYCDGQFLQISEHEALFTLIGTTYGGDGEQNFRLPNLQGRVPLHYGTSSTGVQYVMGQMGGTETETLTLNQIPAHTHPLTATTRLGTDANPAERMVAQTPASIQAYIEDVPAVSMRAGSATPAGAGQAHQNMQPFLVIPFIISLFGVFPSQT